jgi:hypothetical protein
MVQVWSLTPEFLAGEDVNPDEQISRRSGTGKRNVAGCRQSDLHAVLDSSGNINIDCLPLLDSANTVTLSTPRAPRYGASCSTTALTGWRHHHALQRKGLLAGTSTGRTCVSRCSGFETGTRARFAFNDGRDRNRLFNARARFHKRNIDGRFDIFSPLRRPRSRSCASAASWECSKELFKEITGVSSTAAGTTERSAKVLESTESSGSEWWSRERIGVESWLLWRWSILIVRGPLLLVGQDLRRDCQRSWNTATDGKLTS